MKKLLDYRGVRCALRVTEGNLPDMYYVTTASGYCGGRKAYTSCRKIELKQKTTELLNAVTQW